MNNKIIRSINLMSDKLVLVGYKSHLTLVISIYTDKPNTGKKYDNGNSQGTK